MFGERFADRAAHVISKDPANAKWYHQMVQDRIASDGIQGGGFNETLLDFGRAVGGQAKKWIAPAVENITKSGAPEWIIQNTTSGVRAAGAAAAGASKWIRQNAVASAARIGTAADASEWIASLQAGAWRILKQIGMILIRMSDSIVLAVRSTISGLYSGIMSILKSLGNTAGKVKDFVKAFVDMGKKGKGAAEAAARNYSTNTTSFANVTEAMGKKHKLFENVMNKPVDGFPTSTMADKPITGIWDVFGAVAQGVQIASASDAIAGVVSLIVHAMMKFINKGRTESERQRKLKRALHLLATWLADLFGIGLLSAGVTASGLFASLASGGAAFAAPAGVPALLTGLPAIVQLAFVGLASLLSAGAVVIGSIVTVVVIRLLQVYKRKSSAITTILSVLKEIGKFLFKGVMDLLKSFKKEKKVAQKMERKELDAFVRSKRKSRGSRTSPRRPRKAKSPARKSRSRSRRALRRKEEAVPSGFSDFNMGSPRPRRSRTSRISLDDLLIKASRHSRSSSRGSSRSPRRWRR